jgi:DNA-binding MarR family transcriptional regulator
VVEADGTDGRRRLVRLSAKGKAARRTAIAFADEVEHELIERIGPRKAAAMRDGFEALLEATADRQSPLVRRLSTIGRG